MEIRAPYKQHYPAIADLLSASLGEAWDLQALSDRVFYDPDYDPNHAWMAREKGQVLGYLYTLLRGKQAWVKMLAVAPGRQRQGLGRDLLERAIERLQGEGAAEIRVEGSPDYEFYPGVPGRFAAAAAFFKVLGFEAGEPGHLSWVNSKPGELPVAPDKSAVRLWVQGRHPEAWEQVEERLSRARPALVFDPQLGVCLAEPGASVGPLWLEPSADAAMLIVQALALASVETSRDARGLRLHDQRPRAWWSSRLALASTEETQTFIKRLS